MARLALEDAGTSAAREPRAGKVGASSTKPMVKVAVAVVCFVVAGVLIYMNIGDAPRPGDQLAPQEVTAEPNTAAATTTTAPQPVAPTPRAPAVVTPPVAGTETQAGPTSRTVGGNP